MSWLGQNGASRDDFYALADAYKKMYSQENLQETSKTKALDEGLRSALKKFLGKKDAPAEKKPESRGEQLRRKYNIGPERSDTSAKRQILDRARARAERDEKQYGDSVYTKSIADKSKAAYERYLKAGYSKYGADDARKGKKARNEEFETWLDEVLEEGANLSEFTMDEVYDYFCQEVIEEGKMPYPQKKVDKKLADLKKKEDIAMYQGRMDDVDNLWKRQRAIGNKTKMRSEEFESWVDSLLDEGYDLSNITWDEMYDIYLDEALTGERLKRALKKPGGTRYTRRVSEDPAKRATRGGRGGEHDFGAGDRGGGHAAMRRMKEDFESWLDEVLKEGADLSEFTMDEVFDYWENEILSEEIIDEYNVSYADGCLIEEGKKSCKSGYKWDSKKGKCVKKKKSSSSKKSSNKTVVVVKGSGYRGPWMGGHGHHHDDDKDTDKGGNGGGGETGGGDAGGGDGGGE